MKHTLLALSLLLASLPAGMAAAPAPPKIAVQTFSFNRFSLDEALAKIRAAGGTHVECYIGQKIGDGSEEKISPAMSEDASAKVIRLLSKHGIKLVSLGVCIQAAEPEIIANCKLAAKLGASYINVQVPPDAIRLYSKHAAELGLKVAVHNHATDSKLPYYKPETVMAAIRGLNNTGACPDNGHYARAGGNTLDNLKVLEGRVFLIHLKDMDKTGALDASVVPYGEGISDVPAIVRELQRQKFDGYYIIELEGKAARDGETNLRKNLEFLTKLTG
jgi:sugar phosphate isomerase/epimerase